MKYHSPEKVFICEPQTDGNLALEVAERVRVHLKCVTAPDLDKQRELTSAVTLSEPQTKWAEFQTRRTFELACEKVVKIENFFVDDEPIEDFETFYRVGPADMVSWVLKAIMRHEILTEHEIKN